MSSPYVSNPVSASFSKYLKLILPNSSITQQYLIQSCPTFGVKKSRDLTAYNEHLRNDGALIVYLLLSNTTLITVLHISYPDFMT